MYTIIDNNNGVHYKQFDSDQACLDWFKVNYIQFIYSILSCDSIVVYRPNGYLLAYIDTCDGSQIVKSLSDWGVSE